MIDCKKGIVHHDALEILIEALNSNGMSLESIWLRTLSLSVQTR